VLTRFRAEGGSIVITTHYMDEAEVLCDRVAIVDQGRMITLDTPKALIAARRAEARDASRHARGCVREIDRKASAG
jgi:ABC-2 type transport system ATP-binding protein